MKRLLNYTIILSLSLVVGCGVPTNIDADSDEYDYFEKNYKGISTYKGKPFTGSVTDFWKNGQLNYEKFFKDGKRDSVQRAYKPDGQLSSLYSFKDGKMDGDFELYWENGQLSSKSFYKDDKPVGIWEGYYENGQLRERDYHNKDNVIIKSETCRFDSPCSKFFEVDMSIVKNGFSDYSLGVKLKKGTKILFSTSIGKQPNRMTYGEYWDNGYYKGVVNIHLPSQGYTDEELENFELELTNIEKYNKFDNKWNLIKIPVSVTILNSLVIGYKF
ncbi:MAG: hypothetical protein P8H35_08590 [Flavobacteriales bacterium]|nr:hypothetical protein [Flavobacteriales bacterium]